MDIIIEAQKLPEFLFSGWTIAFLVALLLFVVTLIVMVYREDVTLMGFAIIGIVAFFVLSYGNGIYGSEDLKSESRANMVSTISSQYGISSLEKAGEKRIADCTPGSPADNKPYAWVSENPDTLHEGVLVKTAEVDGECLYTLYPKTSTTPPLGG